MHTTIFKVSGRKDFGSQSDISNAHLNFRDRDGHFIFGDACTSVLLEKSNENNQSGHSKSWELN